jgi:hypothetical protein
VLVIFDVFAALSRAGAVIQQIINQLHGINPMMAMK